MYRKGIEYRQLTILKLLFFHHHFLRRTAEYLVTSADTRPYLVILCFRVARCVEVGLEKGLSPLIVRDSTKLTREASRDPPNHTA